MTAVIFVAAVFAYLAFQPAPRECPSGMSRGLASISGRVLR